MTGIAKTRNRVATRCPAKVQTVTTWVLIVGFLLQPILGYLVTPILTQDSSGQAVVVCTLKGHKTVFVDFPPLVGENDSEHCSALQLYQIAGTGQLAAPPVMPAISLYAAALLDQTAQFEDRSLHFSAYSTRAPPIV